jgi:hypothetical protein
MVSVIDQLPCRSVFCRWGNKAGQWSDVLARVAVELPVECVPNRRATLALLERPARKPGALQGIARIWRLLATLRTTCRRARLVSGT